MVTGVQTCALPICFEALESIKASGTSFVVAINKIDKPNVDLSRTQASLLEHHIYLEKLGGDIPWTAISAKTGEGVDTLLDLVLLVAELAEYRGDTSLSASGYVIDAHRDEKRGIAATLIIKNGTLKSGMAVLAGRSIAPVRIMQSHLGKTLKEASFSTPVTLYGFDELPEVGSEFVSYMNKHDAELNRPAFVRSNVNSVEEDTSGKFHLPVIIRADVSGSLEGIAHELAKIGDEYMDTRIVLSGIGAISENDVKAAIASATPAIILGFDVPVDPLARESARQHGVQIETFNIIYKLAERVAELMKEKAPKREVEEKLGRAKILAHFSKRRDAHLVGGAILEGRLEKGAQVRIFRKQEPQGVGKITGLQRNKQNVDRVEEGEFGAQVTSEVEVLQGDVIECFRTQTV
jgi:translation initiation factor IF-2